MGVVRPKTFVEENYKPSIGDKLTIRYELNRGVGASGVGKTTGRVKKVHTEEGEFCGFKMSVDKSDHIPDDREETPSLYVYSRFGSTGNINIYIEWPEDESQRKLNAVPGVELDEVNSYGN